MDPVAAVAQLSTGAPLLRCRADCVADWRRAQPDAARLDAAGRWTELAGLVITINYQDDLTLYYLARAAEGLGFPTAAASYYRQSTHISGTSLSCRHESGLCGGTVLPDVALARIQALESEATRSRPPSSRYPATRAKAAPAGAKPVSPAERKPADSAAPGPEQNQSTASERSDAGAKPSAPSAPASPASPPPASPPPARMDPVAKQYIEPPAAR